MKKPLFILVLTGHVLIGLFYTTHKYNQSRLFKNAKSEARNLADSNVIKNGDLIFQTLLTHEGKLVQLATKAKYSHCGLIFKEDNKFYVLEASQTVKLTPLDTWIAHGDDGHFVIKRLKNAGWVLSPGTLKRMKEIAEAFKAKSYDPYFEWSDDKVYASELVWKIYNRATGMQIGELQKLKDFDLTSLVIRQTLKERYGATIATQDTVISPDAIFNSKHLITVAYNE